MRCRICGKENLVPVVDLGTMPPSNSYLSEEDLDKPEVYYPLKVYYCFDCNLMQIDEVKKAAEIFDNDYVYYSSTSDSWVRHAREYVDDVMDRFWWMFDDKDASVLEIGSNDGYLLQHFIKRGIRCLGVDPCEGAARVAESKGVQTTVAFFNSELAVTMPQFSLICGINVLAHQPNLHDFVNGLKMCLLPGGVITMEFPSLQKLVDGCLFDTIYHEHYSYLSLTSVCKLFGMHGLTVFDVDELDTHGGSFRIYVCHDNEVCYEAGLEKVSGIVEREKLINPGLANFAERIKRVRIDLVNFLINIPRDQLVVGYGAAAKANTIINYCGIGDGLLPAVFDKAPEKIGKYLPGSRIQVCDAKDVYAVSPDYVIIFAWNMKDEIMEQLWGIRKWGGKFVIPLPELEVI